MVAPVIAGGLVKGAFGILGGLFGSSRKRKAQARQNAYNDPKAQRARLENAGFNPAPYLNNGNQAQSDYSPAMSNAIMQAGASIGDSMAEEEQLKIQRAELEMENERLDALVKATTLKANVGGIYGSRETQNGQGSRGNSDNPNGVSGVDTLDNSRKRGDGIANSYDDRVNAPVFTMFGKTFYGSGRFSSGQQMEDSIGDSEVMSTLMAPMIISDAIGHTLALDRAERKARNFDRDAWRRVEDGFALKEERRRWSKAMQRRNTTAY